MSNFLFNFLYRNIPIVIEEKKTIALKLQICQNVCSKPGLILNMC